MLVAENTPFKKHRIEEEENEEPSICTLVAAVGVSMAGDMAKHSGVGYDTAERERPMLVDATEGGIEG